MEIVSKPDMRSADEAKAYVTKLRQIMRYLGTCDGNMEQGSLRADINVSVRRPGGEFGTRCEIKNVNSIRFMGQAVEYEARRQIGILEDGGKIDQETRLFDARKGETRSMRSKEEAHDYRYFPDPDLLPLELDDTWIATIRSSLPELPDDKIARFISDYGLSSYDANVLSAESERAEYYELMVREGGEPKVAANWLINEYLGRVNRQDKQPDPPPMGWFVPNQPPKIQGANHIPSRPTQVFGPLPASTNAAIVAMITSGEISGKTAKDVLDYVYQNPDVDPKQFVAERNLKQVTDSGAIEKAVDAIIAANPDKVAQVRAKPSMLGWFVGQVMKSTSGKANPAAVTAMLSKKLEIN
jgi:aspartyl-tRNA(Asn)/glutamyl-tRNA(Gln) amidotransferase subunit B